MPRLQRLTEAKSLAGLILVMDGETPVPDMSEVPALLTGVFRSLQTLMRSPGKAFCLLIKRHLDASSPAATAAGGVEGMFLSAALEYPSVLFRCVSLDDDTGLQSALDVALDTRRYPVQISFRGQEPFTQAAKVHPIL